VVAEVVEAVAVEPAAVAAQPAGTSPVSWAGVQLGPSLPMAVFTSSERWNAERIGALALYCSDGRWGEAFDEFCHRRLLIPRYDRFAVPGGPAWVTAQGGKANYQQAAREQLDFLVRVHELERIVLITHYGCAYYAEQLHQEPDACVKPQVEDARAAVGTLRQWFPQVKAEVYLAMRMNSVLSFHQIDA
jgi:hypothetical protein